jgi:hypothetical protein
MKLTALMKLAALMALNALCFAQGAYAANVASSVTASSGPWPS